MSWERQARGRDGAPRPVHGSKSGHGLRAVQPALRAAPQASAGPHHTQVEGPEQCEKLARGRCVMWIRWWLWPLVAICSADQFRDEAERIMRGTPVIDGHNDLPWKLLNMFNNQLQDEKANLTSLADTHTNIPKLRAGFVGGQFWSAYTPCDTQNKDAVRRTLEQIDVIHRMCQMYPEAFVCVTDSTGIRQAFWEGRVASLVGVEGGHSIDSSLGVLRTLYHLGMRYLTLTHSCNTPWADNWLVDTGEDKAESQGLSSFGQSVVKEMNRLGVIIDLAHVSVATMKATLRLSKAPVLFSHSSAYSLCHHRRNVPDDVLQLVNQTRSLVMVNFYNDYVSCKKEATLSQVADHLDHIKKVAGAGAVGFGGDFDGVSRRVITHRLLRRSPSQKTSWRLLAGRCTATQRPPASISSQGPCWPPSPPSSLAYVFCDALGSGPLGSYSSREIGHQSRELPAPQAQGLGSSSRQTHSGPLIKAATLLSHEGVCSQHPSPGGGLLDIHGQVL
uniref:Dipeptidase n=2 Tax=Suricata suricatta TaxID=37032 RepID=A0A673UND4_SURSU